MRGIVYLIQIRDLDQTVIGNPAHDSVRLGLWLASAAEDRTLARRRVLRSDLIDPTVAVYKGRVVKRTGEGSLIEIRSAERHGRAQRRRLEPWLSVRRLAQTVLDGGNNGYDCRLSARDCFAYRK